MDPFCSHTLKPIRWQDKASQAAALHDGTSREQIRCPQSLVSRAQK